MHNMGGRVTDMEGLVASVYLVWSALLVLYWLWCMQLRLTLASMCFLSHFQLRVSPIRPDHGAPDG